jgi:hypothetical protein
MVRSDNDARLDGEEGHTKSIWLSLKQYNDTTISMHDATRKQLKMALESA